jgi:hypothetical protein
MLDDNLRDRLERASVIKEFDLHSGAGQHGRLLKQLLESLFVLPAE